MNFNYLITILILLSLISCEEKKNEIEDHLDQRLEPVLSYDEIILLKKKTLSKDSILSNDQKFINNEILKGSYRVDLSKYIDTNCMPLKLRKEELIKNFEGFQNIGDIDNDKKDDFVFVLNSLDYCEEGDSYYFSNPKIPRIYSDSYCCHPNSIFSIGDINEDGRNEIAEYSSGCASRFKSINIWSLKENGSSLLLR